MRRLRTTLLAALGLGVALFVGGFVYGVVAVGIPYQDPTPQQAARERRDTAVSSGAIVAGLLVGAVASAAFLGTLVWSRWKKPDGVPPTGFDVVRRGGRP